MLILGIETLNLDFDYFNKGEEFLFLQMPKVQYKSNCKPSTFAYPALSGSTKRKKKRKGRSFVTLSTIYTYIRAASVLLGFVLNTVMF